MDGLQRRVSTVLNWMWAMAGALGLGVGFPVLLVNFSYGFYSLYRGNMAGDPIGFGQRVGEAVTLYLFGMIFCSPGVAILGSFVYSVVLSDVQQGARWRSTVLSGIGLSVLLSFLNLPGWLCLELLRGSTPLMQGVKAILLFVVAGTAAGYWIARTAWEVAHPEDRISSRFSLTVLLGGVLAWGALMAVFAPKT